MQTGAAPLPFATSRPWTDSTYWARMPAWQAPQVLGTFEACTRDCGSVRGRIPWEPWQSEQFAETRSPLRVTARPWIESM